MAKWTPAATFGLLLACGSGGSASGGGGGATRVIGTVAGSSVPTTDAVSFEEPLVDTFGGFTQNGIGIVISSVADTCSIVQRGTDPPNATALLLIIGTPGDVVPGTYAITTASPPPLATTNNALLAYQVQNADCSLTKVDGARSGSITLSAIDSTTVEGTFEVTMDTGDKLTGSFSAPRCNVPPPDAGTSGAAGSPPNDSSSGASSGMGCNQMWL